MSRIGETANRPHAEVFSGQVDSARAHQDLLRGLDGKQACPFCGAVSERTSSPCQRCGMENTPEARKATKQRIGPWYVLQARNPAAPGMRFETLLSFVRKGRVRARSVVRGPTTHQLWRFAAHVKGLSREFGLCYSCGSAIEPTANICPQCNRLQEPPVNPDVLLEDRGEDGSSPSAATGRGTAPVYRELPAPVETAKPPKPEPDEAEIVIPALGAFGPDDVEVKPVESKPRPEPAPIPAPNWFQSTPATSSAPASPAGPRPAAAAARPPLDENPFNIPSPAPRKKSTTNGGGGGGGDTFLSAKELAAAFKLSFDPSANMDTVDVPDQMPAGALPEDFLPGMTKMPARQPAAAATQLAGPAGGVAAAPRPRGSRWSAFRRVALFMLILGGTGFGVMLWVDPVFRQKTVDWGKSRFARLHAYATAEDMKGPQAGGSASPAAAPDRAAKHESDIPKPHAAPQHEPAGEPKAPAVIEEPTTPAEPEAAAAKAPEPPPAPAPVRKNTAAAPAPAPAAAATPGAAAVGTPAPKPSSPAAPPTNGDAAAKATPAEKEEPIPTTLQEQVARKQQLYKQGRQAEFGNPPNYEAAFKAYSAIKKLSADVWPSDLETRIITVQRKMK